MTPPDEPRILIAAKDGPIAHGPELQSRLQPFTVPIIRFREGDEYPYDVGSGILLKIGDLRFVATAGHCVRGNFPRIHLGVRDYRHAFTLKPVRQNFIVTEARGDFGYYQVSSEQAVYIEAGNRAFLSERSVEVLSAAEHVAAGDFHSLAGYPRAMYGRTDDETGSALLVYSTTMAGGPFAPESTMEAGLATRNEIHLWIPMSGNVNTLTTEPTPATLCELSGASGGGWWATHLNRPDWQPINVKLVGTHVGTTKKATVDKDGLQHKFSRVSLIGNHLALIARDFPTSRAHILATWPAVEQYGI
ncbi:hypothetical protein E2P84_31265 [Burkholderia cepacia]|uniref:Trypsin-like peptidase domain-containing protein n=1 Tax=Burkholderia cepacia TaxID=292 RepID=A0AAX2RCX0_BURCE|nr:hypothetical protein [Burkholderia cepacia]MDN7902156.1 hypothetical protein [Burkholderia cepacia]TES70169.1 hypothetical protein E2P84_31265 [Burkholderia cepacia]TES97470.1 hypothetical protein E3D36_32485 [Burkholderia cepacia]TEU35299.1 hypothetical protein E3D37_37825 [Burkholderia cepacia]TEU40427.1 hypothetical protein E3D38_34680 [Burkholderia cepacia]